MKEVGHCVPGERSGERTEKRCSRVGVHGGKCTGKRRTVPVGMLEPLWETIESYFTGGNVSRAGGVAHGG